MAEDNNDKKTGGGELVRTVKIEAVASRALRAQMGKSLDLVNYGVGIHIDRGWPAADFAELCLAAERVYVTAYHLIRAAEEPGFSAGPIRREGIPPLEIRAISYASPGEISFQGVGEAIQALTSLLKEVMGGHIQDMRRSNIEIKAEKETLRHDVAMNQIAEASSALTLAAHASETLQQLGYAPEEAASFIRRGIIQPAFKLDELMSSGQVTDVEEPRALPAVTPAATEEST